MAIESPYLTEDEAAAYMRVCTRTLQNLRWSGRGPRYCQIHIRSRVTYDRADLDKWMASHKRWSTSDRAGQVVPIKTAS